MDESAMVGNVLVSSLTNKKGGNIGTLFGGGKRNGKSNGKLVVPMSLYSSSTSFQLPENNDSDDDDNNSLDEDDETSKQDEETSNQVLNDDIYDSLLGLMEENKSLDSAHESVTPSNVSMLVEEIEESPEMRSKRHIARDKSSKTRSISSSASSKKHTKKRQPKKQPIKNHKKNDKHHKLTKRNDKKKKRKTTHKSTSNRFIESLQDIF